MRESTHDCVLKCVLGVFAIPGNAINLRQNSSGMAFVELNERVRVSCLGSGNKNSVVHRGRAPYHTEVGLFGD
jgi:hypothetical protein